MPEGPPLVPLSPPGSTSRFLPVGTMVLSSPIFFPFLSALTFLLTCHDLHSKLILLALRVELVPASSVAKKSSLFFRSSVVFSALECLNFPRETIPLLSLSTLQFSPLCLGTSRLFSQVSFVSLFFSPRLYPYLPLVPLGCSSRNFAALFRTAEIEHSPRLLHAVCPLSLPIWLVPSPWSFFSFRARSPTFLRAFFPARGLTLSCPVLGVFKWSERKVPPLT